MTLNYNSLRTFICKIHFSLFRFLNYKNSIKIIITKIRAGMRVRRLRRSPEAPSTGVFYKGVNFSVKARVTNFKSIRNSTVVNISDYLFVFFCLRVAKMLIQFQRGEVKYSGLLEAPEKLNTMRHTFFFQIFTKQSLF